MGYISFVILKYSLFVTQSRWIR